MGLCARGLIADPSSATARQLGDGWSRSEHLLAMIVDELRAANWQRSKDGSKNRNRPKPISPLAQKRGVRTGRTSRSPVEVQGYLARFDPHASGGDA